MTFRRIAFGLIALAAVAAHAATNEATFLSQIRQLTYEGKRAGEGYFSADGKALVFQSEREADNPFYQIYLLDLESGDTTRVSPGTGKTTCAFLRPGTDDVLFASTHHNPDAKKQQQEELAFRASGQQRRYSWDYDETMDIFTARRDGSQVKPLTSERGYDAEAAYSPDGKLIVFSSNRHAYSEPLNDEDRKRLDVDKSYFCELYLMNADGSNVRRLTRTPGYDGGPFFSPDGTRIIWRRFDEHGVIANVFTMKLDGSDVRQLTDFGCMSWAPYFHPSGKYFVFTANKLGFANFELFIADADGTREPVRVTFTDGFDGLPVFAPDGQQLCWTANRTSDQKSQLFLAKWNHDAALQALAQAPARRATPATANPHGATTPATAPTAQNAIPTNGRGVAASPEIREADLRNYVNTLASDEFDGRMTGSEGARKAADYVITQLTQMGIAPLGKDYRHPFEFTAGVTVQSNDCQLTVTTSNAAPVAFKLGEDFRPLSFTANEAFEGEVVFAGYGLSVSDGKGQGYNSYDGLDVSNKIVLVLRYVPEDVEPKRRQELNVHAGLRYKAMIARQRGAKAILVVTGPNSPNAGQLAPLTFDTSLSGSGIIAASISTNVAQAILAAAGKDLKTLQSGLDNENPHAEGSFPVGNVKVRIAAGVKQLKETDHNIVAVLPPGNSLTTPEYVLVGAHYDHLGRGDKSSLERAEEAGQIHNGADDNASGTALLLELAHALAAERAQKPGHFPRGVIFAFWSGEEIGLIGSSRFAENPPVPLTNIVAYLNFDMVGRLRDNKLDLQGVGSSSLWRKLIEKRNVAAGFQANLLDDPYVPSDATAFYPKGIPVLHFFTGSHEDYHRPSDDADKLNVEGIERITKFARGLVNDLVNQPARPDYVTVARAETGRGNRETLRAYLGTIPDYTQEVEGVKLSGVRGGAPAEKAGLKGGDVIVEFAGQQIKNVYDYTYALDAVKIGQPVDVVVLRDGKRVKVTVVPEARK
jgi:Tol biopolymer transport system component